MLYPADDRRKEKGNNLKDCSRGWSRPDSNRCPNKFAVSFLHVYLRINCRELAGTQQTN